MFRDTLLAAGSDQLMPSQSRSRTMVDGVRSWADVVADIAHRVSVLESSDPFIPSARFLNLGKFAVRSMLHHQFIEGPRL
jgi:hypothetical protein